LCCTAPWIFQYNILEIFSSDQWDLLSHNWFVIFVIRLYCIQIFTSDKLHFLSQMRFCCVCWLNILIHHLLLHFDYLIFLKNSYFLQWRYWRNVMVARCNGGELLGGEM
jgi:hypothetical protein